MLYIGFSDYSNKFYAKMFCKKYKHCAPIIVNKNNVEIYQFVHLNKIVKIVIQKSDLKLFKRHGWIFIKYPPVPQKEIPMRRCLTCVQFTKAVCEIKDKRIQTPLALFKYLTGK